MLKQRLKVNKPISHQLRKFRSPIDNSSAVLSTSSIRSIDDLLLELENSDSNDSNTDSDNENEEVDSSIVVKDELGNVVGLVSAFVKDEKIAPLPKVCLPAAQCNTMKHSRSSEYDSKRESSKRVKFSSIRGDAIDTKLLPSVPPNRNTGLEATVRDLMRQYEPASHEKRPFYCRICKFQGSSLADLEAHRESEYHKVAGGVERKMSTCKLCRKEFTSPDQLKDHLAGKGHAERLERARQSTDSRKRFC